jgi:hypothetical protein
MVVFVRKVLLLGERGHASEHVVLLSRRNLHVKIHVMPGRRHQTGVPDLRVTRSSRKGRRLTSTHLIS